MNSYKLLGIYTLRVIASIIIVIIIFLHFAPVQLDAGACSGSYSADIADMCTSDLINLFMKEQKFSTDTQYELISTRNEIVDNTTWKGRTIKTNLTIKIKQKNYLVFFSGKRYWVEKYNWHVSEMKVY